MKQVLKPGLLAVALTFGGNAAAQEELSSAVRSNAFVQMVAERGLECDLLKPWESAALEGLVQDDMARRSAEMQTQMVEEAARLSAETPCDAEGLNVWIEGSSPGFEREVLPPYLVAYLQLAQMETPPEAFTNASALTDYASAIAQIEAKIEALEADGVMPEGGMSWQAYTDRVEEFIAGFTAMLDSGDEGSAEVAQATGLIKKSAQITELWLQEP